MLFICIKIFFARIIDVSLGTIRTVLVVNGKKYFPSFIAFFEVLIWFLIAREALNISLNSFVIPIFYSLGYATGTYIGTIISNYFLPGLLEVSIITKHSLSNKMINSIRKSGFGVSSISLNNTIDKKNKDLLIIELDKTKLKKLTKIIRSIDINAFVTINEIKYVQNGVLK